MTRTILHVDMDAFYVGVELRRRPELRGMPVVVGGTGRRGVVAAASYEARRFGVFSAMPSVTAARKCPGAVFLPGDHDLYSQVSTQVHEIFHRYTPEVEPLALDEAFLDVSGSLRLFGSARAIADAIRQCVADELELACSVGGASNKFVAKLASKQAKPKITDRGIEPGPGVLLVAAGGEVEFLHPLPVGSLWGVGPATLERLRRFGVSTVRDLAMIEIGDLVAAVGRAHGTHLHELAWGRDNRPVETSREAKSIGHEETFAHDRYEASDLIHDAVRLADGVAGRLRRAGWSAKTVSLKVRFTDFTTISRTTTVTAPISTAQAMVVVVEPILRGLDLSRGVRLLGVSVSNFAEVAEQLSFDTFAEDVPGPGGSSASNDADWVTAETTVDEIRNRFGGAAIGPASAVTRTGLRVVRQGAQQWGPGHDP